MRAQAAEDVAKRLGTPHFKIIDVDQMGRPIAESSLSPQMQHHLTKKLRPKPHKPQKQGIKYIKLVYKVDKLNLKASMDAMSPKEYRKAYGRPYGRIIHP